MITRVLIRGRQEGQQERKEMSLRKPRLEGCPLGVEEGPRAKESEHLQRLGKARKWTPPAPPEGIQPSGHLALKL